ncbi:Protein-S-isoprenylcysteine O-methyltransferase Ste14 [Meinhardsimonia xiamenensis]|uniref:Protein-S-isoprenylcysteine O-methyltransferase Ste14 n=2 Tax=Meinhardsimonia xiamenensis TaxID=990712 RepID=A0A1G9F7P5_9RHOB|nr:isoprenylcysteine carboxylmethyltransferase family protein [Meinhardsimonia xiamenensis]PRX37954.1 protein-S-isoprenylcysteine O-methyltransferase Ste14 [Meinhardsimonia xiamenensis]SDK84424.1 Protein-S-isoprenylcysteine O-methyltransferase Ste14 [Meinhardsimonia xiamenensis]
MKWPMKWIDTPPVWLAAFCAMGWGLAVLLPEPPLGPWSVPVGPVLVAAGLVLMFAAVVELRRHRTTVVPHREARALVTTGIYRFSRNPIYLGDVLFLAGFLVWLGAALPLLLIPVFAWVLQRRFIIPEERRLRASFGPAWERWAERTRRWI